MANVVIDTNTFVSSGGRIAHFREAGGRIVTIAYKQSADGSIQYGATIYRKDSDSWVRKQQNQTAVTRATTAPVIIPNRTDWTPAERASAIRCAMYTNGVKSYG